MNKAVMGAAAAGIASTLVALSAFSGTPAGILFAYLAPLPLLLAALAFGPVAAALAGGIATLLAAVAAGLPVAGVTAVLNALPVFVIARLSLLPAPAAAAADAADGSGRTDASPLGSGWPPLGLPLAAVALLLAATVVLLSLIAHDAASIEQAVSQQLRQVLQASGSPLGDADIDALSAVIAPVFVGGSAAIWLIVIAGNAVLAENILAARGWALRPRPAWPSLALPGWYAWPMAATAALALISSGDLAFITRNVTLVLGAAYFLQGLATVHTFSHRSVSARPILVVFYLLLGFFFLFFAPLVAFIGMLDQWVPLRPPGGPGAPGALQRR